jgi:hypothetical protein
MGPGMNHLDPFFGGCAGPVLSQCCLASAYCHVIAPSIITIVLVVLLRSTPLRFYFVLRARICGSRFSFCNLGDIA